MSPLIPLLWREWHLASFSLWNVWTDFDSSSFPRILGSEEKWTRASKLSGKDVWLPCVISLFQKRKVSSPMVALHQNKQVSQEPSNKAKVPWAPVHYISTSMTLLSSTGLIFSFSFSLSAQLWDIYLSRSNLSPTSPTKPFLITPVSKFLQHQDPPMMMVLADDGFYFRSSLRMPHIGLSVWSTSLI